MIQTMRDYENALDKIVDNLRPAENAGLLNDEGLRTIEAFRELATCATFYDDFEEFSECTKVQRIFSNYSDCRKVQSAKIKLEMCINIHKEV